MQLSAALLVARALPLAIVLAGNSTVMSARFYTHVLSEADVYGRL